ncbi:hypothetical protein ZTR_05170 [Talaromyces verruculosus]|nr:hypothetical protein ZTR_05170 [Talaromyces verruculosus]
MRRSLIPNPPRPYILPFSAILQPASFYTPHSVRAQFSSTSHQNQRQQQQSTSEPRSSRSSGVKGHKFQEWKGSSTADHAVNRAAKNDITDPEVEGVATGRAEKQRNSDIADSTMSGATTERDLGRNAKRAKEEHPKSPEPIIGMNDERGEVSLLFFSPVS